MNDLIQTTARDLSRSSKTVALTGAGISVESGIPPFRGKGSLWDKIDPIEYAHINSFMQDPFKVWDVLLREMKNILDNARPNDAHRALFSLENKGILKTVITQNIDGLHQEAGNTDVVEFHGNFAWQRCMTCHRMKKSSDIDLTSLPPKCECGGIYRPDCVFFGEMIPEDCLWRARKAASECDIMLVIGTSGVVEPAASIPASAKSHGAKIIEINPDRTPVSDYVADRFIQGQAGVVMRRILKAVCELKN